MTAYDIEKIYNDLENYLIKNIKKNLTSDLTSFHLKEEKDLGFDWEAWQATKLRELKRYRRQNKEIVNKRLANIDTQIADVLQREMQQGKLDAFRNYKEALTFGYKSSVKVKDSFFRINDKKVNTLINSVNNDFKTANRAVLRRSNDVYRQIIFEASMYNQTGTMTEQQAIRKAIADFEKRGINCIEYSNGAKHKISDYSKMAIRTASTRAYLQGEGEFRKKIGSTLVLMSKHNTACKLCQPWEGKILIDDVYSGGSKSDRKYPLMSDAMKQGLYHPNCRHGHGTYYPELGKDTSNKVIEKTEKKKARVDNRESIKSVANDVFEEHKKNNYENLALFNPRLRKRIGNIHTNKQVSNVSFSSEQKKLMSNYDRELYSIHNHSTNRTFSISDIYTTINEQSLLGSIVTTPDYNYYFKPALKDMNKTKANMNEFKDWFENSLGDLNDELIEKYPNLSTTDLLDMSYKKIFSKLGWTYRKMKK